MDIHELRELMLDIECMTVLRHVMEKPAMAALYRLVCDCANNNTQEGELVYAYCEVYNNWLAAAVSSPFPRGEGAPLGADEVPGRSRRRISRPNSKTKRNILWTFTSCANWSLT